MSLLRIEFMKLYKRKSVKVLLGIYGGLVVLLSLFYIFGEKSLGLTLYTEGQFITASLSAVMAGILPFIALYMSAASFGLEMSQGTLKNMMLLPISKTEFYVNKVLSIISLLGILIGFQFIYSMVFSVILDGGFSLTLLFAAFGEYIGALFVLGLITLTGSLLAMFITSTGLSVFVGYLLYIGMGVLNLYLPVLKPISLTRIISQYQYMFSNNVIQLLSVVAYYIILLMVGLLLFDKKEEDSCLYE